MKDLKEVLVDESYGYSIGSRDFETDKKAIQTIVDLLEETGALYSLMSAAEDEYMTVNNFKNSKFLEALGKSIFDRACKIYNLPTEYIKKGSNGLIVKNE